MRPSVVALSLVATTILPACGPRCEVAFDDCLDDEYCGAGGCTPAFGAAFDVAVLSLDVGERNPFDNRRWDPDDGSDPDLVVVYGYLEGNSWGSDSCQTSVANDTRSATWDDAVCTFTLTQGAHFGFGIFDADPGEFVFAASFDFQGDSSLISFVRGTERGEEVLSMGDVTLTYRVTEAEG